MINIVYYILNYLGRNSFSTHGRKSPFIVRLGTTSVLIPKKFSISPAISTKLSPIGPVISTAISISLFSVARPGHKIRRQPNGKPGISVEVPAYYAAGSALFFQANTLYLQIKIFNESKHAELSHQKIKLGQITLFSIVLLSRSAKASVFCFFSRGRDMPLRLLKISPGLRDYFFRPSIKYFTILASRISALVLFLDRCQDSMPLIADKIVSMAT
jgi:hypothetical protein